MHSQNGDEISRDELFDLAKGRMYEHFVTKGNEMRRCTTARLHAAVDLPPSIPEPVVDDAVDALVREGHMTAQITVEAVRSGSNRHGRTYANIMPLRVDA